MHTYALNMQTHARVWLRKQKHKQTHYTQLAQPANNSETSQNQQMKYVHLYAQQPIRFQQNHERWENFMSCDQMQL